MQMPKVNTMYGAPMGRSESHGEPSGKVHLVRVYLDSGGYDNGGAYWGLGDPLYLAYDDGDLYVFVRATSRTLAKEALDITDAKYYR